MKQTDSPSLRYADTDDLANLATTALRKFPGLKTVW